MRWMLHAARWGSSESNPMGVAIRCVGSASMAGGEAHVSLTMHGAPDMTFLPGDEVSVHAYHDDGSAAAVFALEDGTRSASRTLWVIGLGPEDDVVNASAVLPAVAEEATDRCTEVHPRREAADSAYDVLQRASRDALVSQIHEHDLDAATLAQTVPPGWCMTTPSDAGRHERMRRVALALNARGEGEFTVARPPGSALYHLVGEGGRVLELEPTSWRLERVQAGRGVRLRSERATADPYAFAVELFEPRARWVGDNGMKDPIPVTPTPIQLAGWIGMADNVALEVTLWDASGLRQDTGNGGHVSAGIAVGWAGDRRSQAPAYTTLIDAVVSQGDAPEGWLWLSAPEVPLAGLGRWRTTGESEGFAALESSPGGGHGEDRVMHTDWCDGDNVFVTLPGNGIPIVLGGIGEARTSDGETRTVRIRGAPLRLRGGDGAVAEWSDDGLQIEADMTVNGTVDIE